VSKIAFAVVRLREFSPSGNMLLRIVAGVLFAIWLALLIAGKKGFIHLLLLNALGVLFTELLVTYRTKMTQQYTE
jgi:hypothetical protein